LLDRAREAASENRAVSDYRTVNLPPIRSKAPKIEWCLKCFNPSIAEEWF